MVWPWCWYIVSVQAISSNLTCHSTSSPQQFRPNVQSSQCLVYHGLWKRLFPFLSPEKHTHITNPQISTSLFPQHKISASLRINKVQVQVYYISQHNLLKSSFLHDRLFSDDQIFKCLVMHLYLNLINEISGCITTQAALELNYELSNINATGRDASR